MNETRPPGEDTAEAPDAARPAPDDESGSEGVTGQVTDPALGEGEEPPAPRGSAPSDGLADRGVPSDPNHPSA